MPALSATSHPVSTAWPTWSRTGAPGRPSLPLEIDGTEIDLARLSGTGFALLGAVTRQTSILGRDTRSWARTPSCWTTFRQTGSGACCPVRPSPTTSILHYNDLYLKFMLKFISNPDFIVYNFVVKFFNLWTVLICAVASMARERPFVAFSQCFYLKIGCDGSAKGGLFFFHNYQTVTCVWFVQGSTGVGPNYAGSTSSQTKPHFTSKT